MLETGVHRPPSAGSVDEPCAADHRLGAVLRMTGAGTDEAEAPSRFHGESLGVVGHSVESESVSPSHSSPRTRSALVRRNFGQTSSLKPTEGSSVMIRSNERPIGK